MSPALSYVWRLETYYSLWGPSESTSAQICQLYSILPSFRGLSPAPSLLEALPDFQVPLIHPLLTCLAKQWKRLSSGFSGHQNSTEAGINFSTPSSTVCEQGVGGLLR